MAKRADLKDLEKDRLDPAAAEFIRLVRLAEDGDEKALEALRELARTTHPTLWRQFGDAAYLAREAMVRRAAGENKLAQEAQRHILTERRKELEGPNPTPLEKLLVERLILCWLHVNYADAAYAQSLGEMSWAVAEYQQKRMESAQRRFLTAVRTLAVVRRLAVPSPRVGVQREAGQRGEFLELAEEKQVAGTGGE